MLYQLMNKDKVVATYEEEKRLDDYRYTEIERLDGYVPYGFVDINDWIDGRQIAKHRTSIERLMRELGLTTRHDFISMARCLALTDTFWMKRADEDISWNDVSLYRNPFDDVIARIAFDGTGSVPNVGVAIRSARAAAGRPRRSNHPQNRAYSKPSSTPPS